MIFVATFLAHNYGAVLQAFALQKYLNKTSSGKEVFCLDYRPDYIASHLIHKRVNEGLIRWLAHNVVAFPSRLKRYRGFKRFMGRYINTAPVEKVKDDKNAILIAGSDQIWNKTITNGTLDPLFFFDGFCSEKKCSYAASIGSSLPEDIVEVGKRLRGFQYIGVREEDSLRLLRKIGYETVCLNVDPVFLLDIAEYKPIEKSPTIRDYIFVYTLETSLAEVREKISESKLIYPGSKVVSLGSYKNIYGADIHFNTATPEEFLGLIHHARCVITNSFHVTAFSVMFDIPLISIPLKNGRNGRIETLLRMVDYQGDYSEYKKDKLKALSDESKRYLDYIIE